MESVFPPFSQASRVDARRNARSDRTVARGQEMR